MEKKKDFKYCPYCNGEGSIVITYTEEIDSKILEINEHAGKMGETLVRIECIACKGTGKRRKDYGGYNQ